MIPRIIHQTHKSVDALTPEHRRYRSKNLAINSWWDGWEHRFVGDDGLRHDVEQFRPDLLEVYDNYSHDVQRWDMWRVVVVWHFGGFYMDTDMEIQKSLLPLCSERCVLAQEHHAVPWSVSNYMFGARPKHHFIGHLLEEMAAKAKEIGKAVKADDIYDSTGPALWRWTYKNYSKKRDIVILPTNLPMSLADEFGEYALHKKDGSWRGEEFSIEKDNHKKGYFQTREERERGALVARTFGFDWRKKK